MKSNSFFQNVGHVLNSFLEGKYKNNLQVRIPKEPIPWTLPAKLIVESAASEHKGGPLVFNFQCLDDTCPYDFDVYTFWGVTLRESIPSIQFKTFLKGFGYDDFDKRVEGAEKVGMVSISNGRMKIHFTHEMKARILKTLINSTPDFTRALLPPRMDTGMHYSLHTCDLKDLEKTYHMMTKVNKLSFNGILRSQFVLVSGGFELRLVAGAGRHTK